MNIPFNFNIFGFGGGDDDKGKQAERVVLSHVLWSTGAGFIPLPVADVLAVAAVQLDMVRSLSSVYGVDFRESEGKAIISSLTGASLSRLGAKAVLKLIPGIGSMVGGGAMAILSGASTYAIGQVFKRHFENGGSFLNFDTEQFKRYYEEQFEKGKRVAEDVKNKAKEEQEKASQASDTPSQTPPVQEEPIVHKAPEPAEAPKVDVLQQLKALAELRDNGVLTEEEFAQMKAQVIKHFGGGA